MGWTSVALAIISSPPINCESSRSPLHKIRKKTVRVILITDREKNMNVLKSDRLTYLFTYCLLLH